MDGWEKNWLPRWSAESETDEQESVMLSQKQLEANRRNLSKRGPLSEAGRERLREAARRNRPWERSTGPVSAEGKAVSSRNSLRQGRETDAIREFRSRAIRFLLLDRHLIETLAGLHPTSELEKVREELAAESEWLLARVESGEVGAAQEKS